MSGAAGRRGGAPQATGPNYCRLRVAFRYENKVRVCAVQCHHRECECAIRMRTGGLASSDRVPPLKCNWSTPTASLERAKRRPREGGVHQLRHPQVSRVRTAGPHQPCSFGGPGLGRLPHAAPPKPIQPPPSPWRWFLGDSVARRGAGGADAPGCRADVECVPPPSRRVADRARDPRLHRSGSQERRGVAGVRVRACVGAAG